MSRAIKIRLPSRQVCKMSISHLIIARKRLLIFWFLLVLLLVAVLKSDVLPEDACPGDKVVVLDPGHGGHDSGARGPSGLTEKSVTLQLAQEIKKALSGRHAVYLTRTGDYYLDIDERTAVANHKRANLFISLHTCGCFRHKGHGTAIFYYSGSTGQNFHPLSQKDDISEAGEKLCYWDYSQSPHIRKSKLLATLVHQELVKNPKLVDKGILHSPCLVLRGADMPAILIEVGPFNPSAEENRFRGGAFISPVAEAIARGICEFFKQTSSA